MRYQPVHSTSTRHVQQNCSATMTKRMALFLRFCCIVSLTAASSPPQNPSFKVRLPGRPYDSSDDTNLDGILGSGREFDLFDTRDALQKQHSSTQTDVKFASSTSKRRSTSSYFPKTSSKSSSSSQNQPTFINQVQEFWSENLAHLPKLNVRLEPTTTLKIRKTFRPLKTIIRIGADFNTQLGVWQFKTSWEDTIIGGKLTLAGKELQLTKSWQLKVGTSLFSQQSIYHVMSCHVMSCIVTYPPTALCLYAFCMCGATLMSVPPVTLGPVDDLVTRLRFRAAVDLQTAKAYCRVGFRQERLSPLNIMEGFTLQKQFHLDGTKGNIKLELKANVALPEPELEYSTESSRFITGLGDIDINLEEANLLLDY